jgi:hypothetical protein
VLWGMMIVVNVAWPRAEVYGEVWYRRFAAPMATAAMLGAGLLCRKLVGSRPVGVLEEHRAPGSEVALATVTGSIEESFE